MRHSGNNVQWTNGYPQKQTIACDVADGCFYLICLNGRIVGTLHAPVSSEPTYARYTTDNGPTTSLIT